MNGDRLTRKEIDAIKFRSWSPDMGRLLRHIHSVGVFAPEKPTDEEINATIAKAQGWRRGPDLHWWCFPYTDPVDRKRHMQVVDYSPVSNLGQALEAAAALNQEPAIRVSAHGRYHVEWDEPTGRFGGAAMPSPEAAARWIATKLYEHITNANAEDEVERARRFT